MGDCNFVNTLPIVVPKLLKMKIFCFLTHISQIRQKIFIWKMIANIVSQTL